MILKKLMTKLTILGIVIFSLTACNGDDFSDVGGSLVDNDNFNALVYDQVALNAQSEKIEKVQSNGLSSYALGFYNDPKYGKTTANILTQLKLSQENPSFGNNAELDSVVLVLPYYSTITSQDAYSHEYKLDSVFGNSPMKLEVYRSNYFLRGNDPFDDYDSQAYYSNQGNDFESNLDGLPLYTSNDYKPSSDEITLVGPDTDDGVENGDDEDEDNETVADTTKLSPRIRLKLPKQVFQTAIIDNEGSNRLISNSNFQNYFRGLYLKSESINDQGSLSLLNFGSDDAGVILYYHYDFTDADGEVSEISSTFKLNFGGQIVNVYDTDYQQIPAQDNNLYLKGGQGSMAVINLFADEDQLDSLRQTNWLINEANLKLYVNKDELPGDQDNPQRLFIYDVKNKKVLIDYVMNNDEKDNDILNSHNIHLGRLSKDDDGNLYYKIRVTNYINDIINNDSTNTKLGLVVSQNVNIKTQSKVEVSSGEVTALPTSEVLARNGTVLYGPEAPSDKALKLEIYYTKPD